MGDSDASIPAHHPHPKRRSGDIALPAGTTPEDIAQAIALLRERTNAQGESVEKLWELCGQGGFCEQRFRDLKRRAESIPMWAKVTGGVGMALCGIIFAIYGFIGTRMYDGQADIEKRLPVVESKQATVYTRLDKIDGRFDSLDLRLRDNGEKLTELLTLHKQERGNNGNK